MMKQFIYNLRVYILTVYANYTYQLSIKKALKYSKKYKTAFYVSQTMNQNKPVNLVIFEKHGFKKAMRTKTNALQYNRKGYIYYTPDIHGKNGLSETEIIARKNAYIRSVLDYFNQSNNLSLCGEQS